MWSHPPSLRAHPHVRLTRPIAPPSPYLVPTTALAAAAARGATCSRGRRWRTHPCTRARVDDRPTPRSRARAGTVATLADPDHKTKSRRPWRRPPPPRRATTRTSAPRCGPNWRAAALTRQRWTPALMPCASHELLIDLYSTRHATQFRNAGTLTVTPRISHGGSRLFNRSATTDHFLRPIDTACFKMFVIP